MNRISQRLSTVAKYTVAGVLFGCSFPLGATILDLLVQGHALSVSAMIAVQRSQPLHWIIDTAPFFLGLLAAVAGKRAQENQYYRPFFSMSLDLLCIARFDGTFERVSPSVEKLLGYQPGEMVDQPFLNFTHPDDQAATIEATKKLAQGEDDTDFENRYRCKDGSYRWLSWRSRSVLSQQRLYAIATDVTGRKLMEESLHKQFTELTSGVQVLASSVNQIGGSMSQLLAATAETATTVAQTATTIEEVKQTAYVSSQKAQEISDNAKQAVHVAQAGEQVVEQARAGLARARDQIRSIADSVLQLGTQTQAISEIISSVNDLAEQSNLLAVNAAIEAANAGEQGKGFTVVAREVKRLAEQSKHATTQVRLLLSEIKKASTAAVLVTEQGAKAVEVGVQQSLEAGESIRALSQGIVEASYSVTQIAVSSQQQLVGIDQVSTAIANIRIASQQNTVGIKQVEEAVRNLQEVGQALQNLAEQSTRNQA
jgi:PAS domain S-box-containing protein